MRYYNFVINKIVNLSKLLVILIYKIGQKSFEKVCHVYYPFIVKDIGQIKVMSIRSTITSLINSNKSLSRFGDGEISWMFGHNKVGSFEKSSKSLRKRLIDVLESNDKNLEIGLPDAFNGLSPLTKASSNFWKGILSRYWNRLSKHLDKNKIYYNTNISRCYIDYKNKKYSKYLFSYVRNIWDNKKILIVEGKYSRLGVTSGLFSNARIIKRIECPPVNAFEHYNDILNATTKFLKYHNDYLVLLSLGPTATILAYDLYNLGYRVIDIGQIDLEYEWFLKGAMHKINIPSKYVNSYRVNNGRKVSKIHNNKYISEIYYNVK